jgi:hypothetical protein
VPCRAQLRVGAPGSPLFFAAHLFSLTPPAPANCLHATPRPAASQWENRYLKDTDPFDWYQRYQSNPNLRNLLEKTVPRSAAILVPGCGSSRLSEDMLADGFTGGISNIDISRTAIDLMTDRLKDKAGLTCASRRALRCAPGARAADSRPALAAPLLALPRRPQGKS